VLADRLQASPTTRNIAVVNMGIGGNHLLTDGLGPNALARLDRDVFARPGAKVMLLLEAINDLGKLSREDVRTPDQHKALVADLIAAYRQMIARAHGQGIRVIGCTVTPYVGSDYYHPDAASEADRVALNTWIRTSGAFDLVVDFDKAIRDPANPERMLPAYDSGDHLHPSVAGYKVMADMIPLEALR
jgi:lysophospholipase L1-like esterase